jgi:hypothetical protein
VGFAKEPLPDFMEGTAVSDCHGMACSNSTQHVQGHVQGQPTKGEIRYGQSMVQARKPLTEGIRRRQGFGAQREQQQEGRTTFAPALSRIMQHIQ